MKRSSQPNPPGEDNGSGGSWSSSAKRFMDISKRSTTPLEDGKKVDLLHDTGQQHGNVRSSNPYSRPSTSYSRTSSTITAASGAGPSFSLSLSGLGASASSTTTSMVNERPAHRSNYSLELKEFLARKKSEREQQQNIPSLTHRSVHPSSSLLTSVRNRSSMTPSTSSSVTHTFSSSLMPSSSTTTAWSQRLPSSSSSRPGGQYQREDGDNLSDVSFQPKSLPSFKFASGPLSTSSTTAASGKVIFGGASARRVARLASANPYFRTVTGSRPAPPVLRVHVSDGKRSPINEDDMLSSSAKRVFDVITRLTTPLEDAKKIPLNDSGLSNRTVYGTYNGPYRGHLASLSKSSLSRARTPPSTASSSTLPIATPGISSSLIQKSAPPPPTVRDQSHRLNWKLEFKDFVDKPSEKQHSEPSTSQSLPQSKLLSDVATTPVASDNRGGLSSTLKMRTQKSSGRLSTRLEEQQRPLEETVELPDISLQPKSLPKFNFSSAITSTPVPSPSTKLSSPTEEFIFSPPPPIPSPQISKPATSSQPEMKESFEFKFSSSTGKKRISFSESNEFFAADSEKYNKVTFPSTSRSPLTETNKPPPAVPAIPAEKSTSKWKCDSCWILNPETQPKCMACDEARPSANGVLQKTTIPAADKTSAKFILDATPQNAKGMPSPTFGSSPINVTPQANKVSAKSASWRCDTCLITNPETIKKCQACEMPRPSQNATSLEETPAYKFGNLSEAGNTTPAPFRFGFQSKVNDTSAITNNVSDEKKDDKLEKNEKETSAKPAAPALPIANSIVSSSKNDNPPIVNFGFPSEKAPSTPQTLSTQQPSTTPSISFGDSNSTATQVRKLSNSTESAQQNSLSTTSASTPFTFGIQNTVSNISSTEPAKLTGEAKKLDEKLDKAENINSEKTSTSSFAGFNFAGNNSGFKFGDTDSGLKFGDNSGIKFGVALEKKEQTAEKSAATPISESQPSQGFSFPTSSSSSSSPFIFGVSTATTTTTAATTPVTTTTTAAIPASFSFNVPSTNPPTFVSLSAPTAQTSKADADGKKDQDSGATEKGIFGKPPSSIFGNTIVPTSKTENSPPSSLFTPPSLQPPSTTSTLLPASLQPSKTSFSFLGQSNSTTFQFGNSSQLPSQSSILQPSTSSTIPPFGSLFSAKPNDTSAPGISSVNEEKKDNKVEAEKPASTPLLFGNSNATFPNFKNDSTPNFNFGSNALQQPSSSPFTGNQQPSATSPFSFANPSLPSNFKFGNAAPSQPNSQQPATPFFQFGGSTPNQGTPSSSGYNFAAAIASPAVPIFGTPANNIASPPQPFSTPNAPFNPLVNQSGTPSFFTPGATGNANTPYGTASKSGRTMIKAKRRLGGGR